jgi:hypothetical protein
MTNDPISGDREFLVAAYFAFNARHIDAVLALRVGIDSSAR